MEQYKLIVELDDGTTRVGAELTAADIVSEFRDDVRGVTVTEDGKPVKRVVPKAGE